MSSIPTEQEIFVTQIGDGDSLYAKRSAIDATYGQSGYVARYVFAGVVKVTANVEQFESDQEKKNG